MKIYGLFVAILFSVFTGSFLLVEHLQLPLLTDPTNVLKQGGWMAGLVGVGLLASDIVLPVPSSIIMIVHGALFGVVVGTALSVLGGLASALIGFGLGRRGTAFIHRSVSDKERQRADQLMQRWGLIAVIVTRPIPILAETVSLVAGSSPISWQAMIGASLVGLIPGAAIYAATGAYALTINSVVWSFGLVIGLAGLFWLIGRTLGRSSPSDP